MKFFKDLKIKLETIYDQTTAVVRLIANLQISVNKLHENTRKQIELEVTPPLLTVARHTLGSIDVADIEDPDQMEEEAYNEYVARSMQFLSFFEKEAKHIMKLQHDFWFRNSESWDQSMFGRGTTNGIQLLLDRFELLKTKHMERIKRTEEHPIGSRDDILGKLQVEGSDNLADQMGESNK